MQRAGTTANRLRPLSLHAGEIHTAPEHDAPETVCGREQRIQPRGGIRTLSQYIWVAHSQHVGKRHPAGGILRFAGKRSHGYAFVATATTGTEWCLRYVIL